MPPNIPQKENPDENKTTEADTSLAPIRTYKSDIETILKGGRTSTAGMVVAEAAKRAGGPLPTDEEEKSWKAGRIIAIAVAAFLFMGGAGILGYFFLLRDTTENNLGLIATDKMVILVNAVKEIPADNLNRVSLVNAVLSARDGSALKIGEVEEIRFTTIQINADETQTKNSISAENFLTLIETTAPAFLVRSFQNEFLLGLHIYTGGAKPFIIFKTESFENSFAGMLKWEDTLWNDLRPILSGTAWTENSLLDNTDQASSSPITNQKPYWSDGVLQNKDVRILKDGAGETLLFYSFVDEKTLVITESVPAFREALTRLKTAALVR